MQIAFQEMDLGYSLKPNPMEPCLTAGSHLQKVPQPFRKHQWLRPKAPTHEYPHCWYSFTQLHNLRIQLCYFFWHISFILQLGPFAMLSVLAPINDKTYGVLDTESGQWHRLLVPQ